MWVFDVAWSMVYGVPVVAIGCGALTLRVRWVYMLFGRLAYNYVWLYWEGIVMSVFVWVCIGSSYICALGAFRWAVLLMLV